MTKCCNDLQRNTNKIVQKKATGDRENAIAPKQLIITYFAFIFAAINLIESGSKNFLIKVGH